MKRFLPGVFFLAVLASAQAQQERTKEQREAIKEEMALRRSVDAEMFEAVPAAYKAGTGVFLVEEGASAEHENQPVFRMVNLSKASVYYVGYLANSPIVEMERFENGRWNAVGLGYCGTDLGISELPAGKSVVFPMNRDFVKGRIRVGIRLVEGEGERLGVGIRTIWSSP